MATSQGRLIGLYSPVMQSGKSTVANTLVGDRGWKLVKFARGPKEMVRCLLRMTPAPEALIEEMLEGSLKEQPIPGLDVTTRHLMQTLGTEWGREQVNSDLWVDLAMAKVREHWQLGHDVVVDDLRFPNELHALQNAGGVVLRVDRPNSSAYKAHKSEGLLDNAPLPSIQNGGSVEDLRRLARELPEQLFKNPG